MNNGGDAAEQIVRLSLEGFEVAVKLTGSAAKNIAILLASVLKQEISQSNKTRGKARIPMTARMIADCLLLSRFTTGFLFYHFELASWGVTDFDNQIVNGVGGLSLFFEVGLFIVQGTDHNAVFIIVQSDMVEFFFHHSYLRLSLLFL